MNNDILKQLAAMGLEVDGCGIANTQANVDRLEALTPHLYEFQQNNEFGHTYIDEDEGIGHFVIIEALSPNAANGKAMEDLFMPFSTTRWSLCDQDDIVLDVESVLQSAQAFANAIYETVTVAVHRIGQRFEWYELTVDKQDEHAHRDRR